MSVQVKFRRDTAANIAGFTPAQGELVFDTTNNRIIGGDGATAGGFAAAKLAEVLLASARAAASGVASLDGATRLPIAQLPAQLATTGYTVAGLSGIASPQAGWRAHVTDATSPTFLGALTGGGSVKCPVFYNGSAWVAG